MILQKIDKIQAQHIVTKMSDFLRLIMQINAWLFHNKSAKFAIFSADFTYLRYFCHISTKLAPNCRNLNSPHGRYFLNVRFCFALLSNYFSESQWDSQLNSQIINFSRGWYFLNVGFFFFENTLFYGKSANFAIILPKMQNSQLTVEIWTF